MKVKKILFPLFVVSLMLFQITGCGTLKKVPVISETITHIKDSIRITDSVRFIDSLIYTMIPHEKDMDMVSWKDSSFLETSVATSSAFIDTTSHTIKHTLENKKDSIRTKIVYRDKIRYIDKIVYHDSIQTKEIPYPVEVEKKVTPKWAWISLIFNTIILCFIGFKIYLKFRKI